MSDLIIEKVIIEDVAIHPNADRLSLATIKGWQVVVGKDSYKSGDEVIYVPIDSVLSDELMDKVFANTKIRPSGNRIKAIKLRKEISYGLVIDPRDFSLEYIKANVSKYEPPVKGCGFNGGGKPDKLKHRSNSNFKRYTHIQNYRNFSKIFTPEDDVVVTEKIHGTNFRVGWVKTEANTIWKKFKKFIGVLPEYEFVYGSHNVQLQNKFLTKTYYDKNVYAEIVEKYDLKEVIPKGIVIYGEIYGSGIQKNYTYGCKEGEHKLVVFDIMENELYLDTDKVFEFCYEILLLPQVPILYVGKFDYDKIVALTKGNSFLAPTQKIREGVVIKSANEEYDNRVGRKMLKLVSEDYLLRKDNTDFH